MDDHSPLRLWLRVKLKYVPCLSTTDFEKTLVRSLVRSRSRPARSARMLFTAATAETSPIPADSSQKQDAATKVLREGVLRQDQGADEAIDRLPDRTAAGRHHPQGQ